MASANLEGLLVILPLHLGAGVVAVGMEAFGEEALGVDAQLDEGLTGKEATRIVSLISGAAFEGTVSRGAGGGAAGGAAEGSVGGITGGATGGAGEAIGGADGGFSG